MGYNKRFNARRDKNEKDIVNALRQFNISVERLDVIDLLVSADEENYLIEIKNGDAKLNKGQEIWHEEWPGDKSIARTLEEVLKYIGFDINKGRFKQRFICLPDDPDLSHDHPEIRIHLDAKGGYRKEPDSLTSITCQKYCEFAGPAAQACLHKRPEIFFNTVEMLYHCKSYRHKKRLL